MALKESEVIGQLDRIAGEVAANRQRLREAKEAVEARVANLNSIPTRYADLISTVNDAEYGGDTYRDANKAQLAALTAEYLVLVSEAEDARNWLEANTTEF